MERQPVYFSFIMFSCENTVEFFGIGVKIACFQKIKPFVIEKILQNTSYKCKIHFCFSTLLTINEQVRDFA